MIQWFQTILCCVPIVVGLCVCGRGLVKSIKDQKQPLASNAAHEESLLLAEICLAVTLQWKIELVQPFEDNSLMRDSCGTAFFMNVFS